MPDRTTLKIGDKIRLLRVPQSDLAQRERELRDGQEGAGLTADTLEHIIRTNPVVTIDDVDEYGYPWFTRRLKNADGRFELHTLAIMDDESWERVTRRKRTAQ